MSKVKVSVIVPVYNVEKYLDKCLDSLVNQTLKDIEIIIINDGSPDNSDKIIKQYKSMYPKIIKEKKIKNGGVANARNIGLKMATGDYVGFVDSDDYIDVTMFEQLYKKAKSSKADVCVCGYYIVKNGTLTATQIDDEDNYGFSVRENPNIFVTGVPYIWNKIFKREVVVKNKIKFKKYRIFEDLLFTYECFYYSNKIAKVNLPLYFYIKRGKDSVTAKFSEKFFDIFPAMQDLKKIYKNEYDFFEQYITYIALNHIYIRFNSPIKFSQIKLKHQYMKKSFRFLDAFFPKWKDSLYFLNKKIKNKKYNIFSWSINILIPKKLKQLINKVKRIKKSLIGAKYYKYVKKCKIKDKTIFIDSQHGNDINGNMFYIIKELLSDVRYKNYNLFISVDKRRVDEFKTKLSFYGLSDCKLLINDSKEYVKMLATAKFLFTDTSFPIYFTKRKEQVYLNTWHGTPLKTLGIQVEKEFYNISNLQRNFMMADYLTYPSKFMMQRMLEDYCINCIENKVLMCGYPRNTAFLNDTDICNNGKQKIAYMPTWRGVLTSLGNKSTIDILKGHLDLLDKKLNDNQILYVNLHPYEKDLIDLSKYKKIVPFPKEYETYHFLNSCDVLITDYSSVFFDFALTRKKIILFTYDEKDYLANRGMYLSLDELPFPKVKNVTGLIKEINNYQEYDYNNFIETYCRYDESDVTKKICEKVILNKKNSLKQLAIKSISNNESILLQSNNFLEEVINEELFDNIRNVNYDIYDIYIGFVNSKIRKNRFFLKKISNCKYMGQYGYFSNSSFLEKLMLFGLRKLPFLYDVFYKYINNILKKELIRIYPVYKFDYVILFRELDIRKIYLYSLIDSNKIIYIDKINKKINKKVYNKFDKIYVRNNNDKKQLSKYVDSNKIIIKENNSIEQML